jgi:Stress responsive A/B Barrel Domain
LVIGGRLFLRELKMHASPTVSEFPACLAPESAENPRIMFSHVVIFWTDPAKHEAADAVIAGANKYLKSIPGVLHFHIGKMSPSHRPVVDQTYQVALNIGFNNKNEESEYQSHPQHLEFVEHYVKPLVKKVVVYDFE